MGNRMPENLEFVKKLYKVTHSRGVDEVVAHDFVLQTREVALDSMVMDAELYIYKKLDAYNAEKHKVGFFAEVLSVVMVEAIQDEDAPLLIGVSQNVSTDL